MFRISSALTALAIVVALAPSAAAQSGPDVPTDNVSFRLGQQVAGSRLTLGDLEGRVVLAYHWCVS